MAIDAAGRPSFSDLQNYQTSRASLFYYLFHLLIYRGMDLRQRPLKERRAMLETKIMSRLSDPIRLSEILLADPRKLRSWFAPHAGNDTFGGVSIVQVLACHHPRDVTTSSQSRLNRGPSTAAANRTGTPFGSGRIRIKPSRLSNVIGRSQISIPSHPTAAAQVNGS